MTIYTNNWDVKKLQEQVRKRYIKRVNQMNNQSLHFDLNDKNIYVALIQINLLFKSDLIESTVCQAYKNANVIKHVQAAIINNIEISEHSENSDSDKKNECIKNMLVLLTRLCYSKNENYFAVNLDTELIVSLLSKKSEDIQKYSLDILIQIAIQNPNAAANLIKSESLLNCIESHTKKVILLMSMIPSKRKELQTWLKNNEITADKDENLTKLCNKFLSAI